MFKFKNIKKSKIAAVAIGTAVKVLTAVVCGAVVLTGTYGVVKHTVLPTSTAKTKSMFAYEGGADTGGGSGGSAGDNPVYETEIKRLSGAAVPEGAVYKLKNGTILTSFPDSPTAGDTYTEGDYEYRYGYSLYNYGDGATVWDSWSGQNGWGVKTKDNSKASYGALIDEIAGKRITSLRYTFYKCSLMTSAPKVSKHIENLEQTFYGCSSLVGPIEINATLGSSSITQCLYGTQVTQITGECTNAAALLNTKNDNNDYSDSPW